MNAMNNNSNRNHNHQPFIPNASIPPGSNLILLHDLPHQSFGARVRFCGCVSSYTTATATLTLTAGYQDPPSSPTQTATATATATSSPTPNPTLRLPAVSVIAEVDISHVLETLPSHPSSSSLLRKGVWVNIVGWYSGCSSPSPSTPRQRNDGTDTAVNGAVSAENEAGYGGGGDAAVVERVRVKVLAVMIWDAGSNGGVAAMERYGKAVGARKEAMKAMREARLGGS